MYQKSGIMNRYGHPHEDTIERLKAVGSEILSAQDCGAIMLEVEEGKYGITSYLKDGKAKE